jgi:glycosyltransferase
MPPHPTFYVRKRTLDRLGVYRTDMGTAADYELMLRYLYKYRVKAAYIPEVQVCMRVGGASNASLGSRLAANRMDRKAWDVNGLRAAPWTLLLKPLRKIFQWRLRGAAGP